MEISQGNSLCSHLYLKLKCHGFFCFIFSLFFSYKIENRRVEQDLAREEGWHQWERGSVGEWGRRVNTVQKLCTHVSKCKNDNC
jgi:hypothetical protein